MSLPTTKLDNLVSQASKRASKKHRYVASILAVGKA